MIESDRSVDGVAKTIAEVLEKKKYSIDYYQREYKWESKQIAELVADLTAKFLDIYEPDHARKQVAKYPAFSNPTAIPQISFASRPFSSTN